MGLKELFASQSFRALPEEEQIDRLRAESVDFAGAHQLDPEAALEWLRKKTSKPQDETSVVGEVIRQFGSGVGESFTDVAQLPFEAAEWVASQAGSEWTTGVDEAIERFGAHAFPEDDTTGAGRIARGAGYGVGIGLQTALTGGALGSAGVAVRSAKLLKTGRLLSGGLGLETGAGFAGGAAGSGAAEFTDNPWLIAGAGILAGVTGVGVAIAARGALARKAAQKAGEAAASPSGGPLSPAEQAARDAAENATTDEVKSGALGIEPRELAAANEFDAQQTLEGFVRGTQATMEPAQLERITKAAGQALEDAGLAYDPAHTLTSQLAAILDSDRMPRQQLNEILNRFGTSFEEIASDELADAYLMAARHHGAGLNVYSQMGKRLRAASATRKREMGRALTDEEKAAFREVGGPNGEGLSYWRRMENVRRGLLVTQVATMMRNFETQVANLGVHALEDSLDAAIKFIFPFGDAAKRAHPTNALGPLSRLMGSFNPFKKSKSFEQVTELKKFFKQEIDPLYARYSSDIETAIGSGPVGGLEKGVLLLNSGNRLQEYAIRRSVFTSELDRVLSAKGQSLEKLIDAGALGSLPRKDVEAAVARALEMTWGSEFHSGMDGVKGLAGNFIDLVNRMGVGPFRATQVIPFPRFMANSIRWQFEHSPFKLMKSLVSPTEWRRIAAGDLQPLIRSTVGTGMLYAAHQIRSSDMAGEKWYLIRPSNDAAEVLGIQPGSTIDIRPFNPFASFLFTADIIKKVSEGTLDSFTGRDIAMGLMATNLRAGAGMYVLDQFLDSVSQGFQGFNTAEGQEAAFKELGVGLANYTGAAWSGALVPFQQLRDIVSSFDETQATLRDASAEPGQGAFKQKLPYAGENLPEVELPTRAAAPQTGAGQKTGLRLGFPLGRQLTGLTTRGPKSVGERELDRLGFTRGNILPSTGDDEYDRIRAKHMGPLFERFVNPLVSSRAYQNAPDEMKGVILERVLQRVRKGATSLAARESPELYRKTREGRRSKRQRKLIASRRRDLAERRARLEEQRRAQ